MQFETMAKGMIANMIEQFTTGDRHVLDWRLCPISGLPYLHLTDVAPSPANHEGDLNETPAQ